MPTDLTFRPGVALFCIVLGTVRSSEHTYNAQMSCSSQEQTLNHDRSCLLQVQAQVSISKSEEANSEFTSFSKSADVGSLTMQARIDVEGEKNIASQLSIPMMMAGSVATQFVPPELADGDGYMNLVEEESGEGVAKDGHGLTSGGEDVVSSDAVTAGVNQLTRTVSTNITSTKAALKCDEALDIVLVLDGVPKSGQKGFYKQIQAANLFVDAFKGNSTKSKANFAIIYYAGPRTWSGVNKCTGNSDAIDWAVHCKVYVPQHFSSNLSKVKESINGLRYQPGAKLLSLGLTLAESELGLGRRHVTPVVVVFMDGQPLSYRTSGLASKAIKKKARLLFVPVYKFSPLPNIQRWVTSPWQKNLVTVETAIKWADPAMVSRIIAKICPRKPQKKNKKNPNSEFDESSPKTTM